MHINRPESNQPMPFDARRVHKGVIFDVYEWEQEQFDGSTQTFEKIRRPDTVVVFAVLDDGRILLTKQQQPGKAPFIGACGGRIEDEEDVLAAARREFLEETGYTAEQYTLWKAYQPISKIDWAVYIFIAKGCIRTRGQSLDSGERIELMPVSFDEFLRIARTPAFSEKEVLPEIYEALLDPIALAQLKVLFDPIV